MAIQNGDSRLHVVDAFVMLCDWRGRCNWTSGGYLPAKIGEFMWDHLSSESQKATRASFGQVVTLRETQHLEVIDQNGDRIRGWLWPLDSPENAVCMLGSRIPGNLVLLTDRERECLELLAQGLEPRVVAEQLDVSVSTIHTHFKHAREKLGLPSLESLISFAARYCPSMGVRLDAEAGRQL